MWICVITVTLLNLHEEERSKPSAWIPVPGPAWIPNYDKEIATERHNSGFDSRVVRKLEIFHSCMRALLFEFSDCDPGTSVHPWSDGNDRATVIGFGGIIGDQQEADHATRQATVCHRCIFLKF